MHLPFQMYIDNNLLKNDVDLDDEFNTTSRVLLINLREMVVLKGGHWQKI